MTASHEARVAHEAREAHEAHKAHPGGPRRHAMLLVVLSALFMAQFDLFVVNIATAELHRELRAGEGALELVVGGYAFTFAAGMITGGRLGDRFGYRRVFLAGMAAFVLASLLCGLAMTPGQLVGARLLQGLAGSVMVPQVLSLITVSYAPEERGLATAWYGFAAGIGAISGQILGALLLQADVLGLGWRVIFLVNVPVGALALALAARLLPRTPARPARFDPLGAAGVTAALALALVPLSLGREAGWPAWAWLTLAASVPVGALAVRWQLALRARGGSPVLDLGLLRNRRYVAVLGASAAFQLYFGSFMFAMSLLLQQGLGRGALQTGLTFLPQSLLFSAAALLGGRLAARYGRRAMLAGGGTVLAGLALLLVLLSGDGPTAASLSVPLALVGLGNGLVAPPLIGAALAEVSGDQAGAASGMVSTGQQFANALGVAVFGALYFAADSARDGMRVTALAHMALVALVLVLLASSTPLRKPRN